MRAQLMGREVQNSPEWHALRSTGIGGSEIAAVVGLSPWVSRFALYHRKRGSIGEQKADAGMDWGTRLEDAICQKFAETHDPMDVEKAGTYRNLERHWQIANVDRLLYDDEYEDGPCALLEAKTAHQYDAYEWGDGPEDIPPYYRCQALWYLDALGLNLAHVAVLIGGSDYREYQIPYVADEAEWLREQGRKFWVDVTEGNAPPIDGHAATYQAVRTLHPDIEPDQEVELDADLWAEYSDSKTALLAAQDRHQQAKNQVLAQMGQAKYAQVNGESVLRRQPGRGDSVSLQPVRAPKASAA